MAGKAAESAFAIKGQLSVVDSTTVICLRAAPAGAPARTLPASQFDRGGGILFNGRPAATFTSGWQVLMGQAEVVNWLRSTERKQALMRYAGEFKFAGGAVDPGESVAAAGLLLLLLHPSCSTWLFLLLFLPLLLHLLLLLLLLLFGLLLR